MNCASDSQSKISLHPANTEVVKPYFVKIWVWLKICPANLKIVNIGGSALQYLDVLQMETHSLDGLFKRILGIYSGLQSLDILKWQLRHSLPPKFAVLTTKILATISMDIFYLFLSYLS